MNKTKLVVLFVALSASTSVASAEGSPELNRPFGSPRIFGAPTSVATTGAPVTSDADAYARLQAHGYRSINLARGSDGAWHGTAVRGATKVYVMVGSDGRVLTR